MKKFDSEDTSLDEVGGLWREARKSIPFVVDNEVVTIVKDFQIAFNLVLTAIGNEKSFLSVVVIRECAFEPVHFFWN